MRISDWSSDVCSSDLSRSIADATRTLNRCADSDGRVDRAVPTRLHKGSIIGERKDQAKRTAIAGCAFDRDLATQEPRQFAGNGQAQASSPILPAGRAVCLPERFENHLLLVRRNTDARIPDGESQTIFRG